MIKNVNFFLVYSACRICRIFFLARKFLRREDPMEGEGENYAPIEITPKKVRFSIIIPLCQVPFSAWS